MIRENCWCQGCQPPKGPKLSDVFRENSDKKFQRPNKDLKVEPTEAPKFCCFSKYMPQNTAATETFPLPALVTIQNSEI